MVRRLWRSKVLGIVVCLGIAMGAAILVMGNGSGPSGSVTDPSDARRVTTQRPEEAPVEKVELPGEPAISRVNPASRPESRTHERPPSTAGSKPAAKAPSEPVDRAPPAAGGNVPDAGGRAAPGGESSESSRRENSAEAHPDDRGVRFTRDRVGVEINPGGRSDRQDPDDDDPEDRDVDEGEAGDD